eukprot:CAMPEP_0170510052 /NCGR_PEP_ID=MMETSP0208-20121228/65551_1 /TAXON_ID=197538 /ORGANISM="Strombidium inclinatum, Strain S3" /LENGTH=134 /DNA_ID=CAMNT_0010793473 /DNA_START=201 /DNA_END=602 /DNA_ORIENTATION=-
MQVHEAEADGDMVEEPTPLKLPPEPSPVALKSESEGPVPESKGSDPMSLPKIPSEVSLNERELNLKEQELILMRPWVFAWFLICAFFDVSALIDISLWTKFEATTLILQYTQTIFLGICSWQAYKASRLEFAKW